jgi:hypothetical protein
MVCLLLMMGAVYIYKEMLLFSPNFEGNSFSQNFCHSKLISFHFGLGSV